MFILLEHTKCICLFIMYYKGTWRIWCSRKGHWTTYLSTSGSYYSLMIGVVCLVQLDWTVNRHLLVNNVFQYLNVRLMCRQKRSVNSSSIALLHENVKLGPDGEPPPLLPGKMPESSTGKHMHSALLILLDICLILKVSFFCCVSRSYTFTDSKIHRNSLYQVLLVSGGHYAFLMARE